MSGVHLILFAFYTNNFLFLKHFVFIAIHKSKHNNKTVDLIFTKTISGFITSCYNFFFCISLSQNKLSLYFNLLDTFSLSIPHDDDDKCMRFREEGQRHHIMARMLDYNSHPWTWSTCSRHYITEFLEYVYYNELCLTLMSDKYKHS